MKVLTLSLLLVVSFYFHPLVIEKENLTIQSPANTWKHNVKALQILENKCNKCHFKRKRIVFTQENMSEWTTKINQQVFIKKRMPKGRKNQLTTEERLILKNWLEENL